MLVFSSANVLFGKFLVFNKHTKQVNQNAKKCLKVSFSIMLIKLVIGLRP